MAEGQRVGEKEIREALAYADAVFNEQRFEEAGRVYSDVAREIEFQFGEDLHANRSMSNHPAIPVHIYALQRLGDCLHKTSQLRDCIPVYERVVRAKSRFQQSFDNEYADLIMKIARTYEQLGNYNESKSTYEEALMLVRGALGFEHPLFKRVHQAYENLSVKINQRKKIAEALKSAFSDTDVTAVASNIASGAYQTPQVSQTPSGFSIDPNEALSQAQFPPAPSNRPTSQVETASITNLEIPEPPLSMPPNTVSLEASPQPPALSRNPFADHGQTFSEPRRRDPAADPYVQHLAGKVSNLKSLRGESDSAMQDGQRPAFPEEESIVAPVHNHNPDPYLDHLASRVAELRAQVSSIPSGARKASQSGIWNLAELSMDADIKASDGVSWHIQESTQQNQALKIELPSVEEIKSITTRESQVPDVPVDKVSARKATIKGEKLSSGLLNAREYIIAGCVVTGLIIGGIYLFKDQKQKNVELGSTTPVTSQAQGKSQTYTSGDSKLSLVIGENNLATYQKEKSAIQVPVVNYDSITSVFQQLLDSVMERQLWFSREGKDSSIVTENGVRLYLAGSPEQKTIADAKCWYLKVHQAFAVPQNVNINALRLPGNVTVRAIADITEQEKKEHIQSLQTGQMMVDESRTGANEIRLYSLSDKADKPPTVYARATDSQGRWIGTANSGEALVLGVNQELLQMPVQAKISVPPKPTKIWIGNNMSWILYLIHYIVPVLLGITGGAMMVVGNNKNLHSVTVGSYVVLFLAALAGLAQYVMWL
ncbi:MAG: hypothetical protein KIT34_11655 [Cyanobacteria bacterium TGS_CYA1]|nr:hypothetical protein [Cyanobacteria bacterium TGS_CYA1]